MSGRPSAFADLFWEHLSPRLTRLCVALARCVAADVETYDGAWGSIYAYARKYGASHLLPHEQDELRDWITVSLGAAIFEAEDGGWSEWLEQNHIGPGARV